MVRTTLVTLASLAVLAVVVAGGGLLWAHAGVRAERSPLPATAPFAEGARQDGPVRLSIVNTASQAMPRSAVLDAGLDRHSEREYVMSHPSFVLEWADGRLLLIDAGMTRSGAADFGAPLEFVGAEPIRAHGSVAEQLGPALARVRGLLFTHVHEDHVGGLTEICNRGGHPVRVPMTAAQAERPNYSTRPGLRLVRSASCSRPEHLDEPGPVPVRGFPGVSVFAAGGHTPGSQLIVARLRGAPAAHVFVGDIVNHLDGINDDLPKPLLYRLLVVPEDGQRLGEWRRFLRDLRERYGTFLLVSHDQRSLERSGVPPFAP